MFSLITYAVFLLVVLKFAPRTGLTLVAIAYAKATNPDFVLLLQSFMGSEYEIYINWLFFLGIFIGWVEWHWFVRRTSHN